MTSKEEKVIGLWQDNEPGGNHGSPWIVSQDLFDEHGGAITTKTLHVYDRDEYHKARERAIEIGEKRGVRVVETDRHGQQSIVYEP